MKMLIVVLLAALTCVGCGKKEDAAPAATTKPEKVAEALKDGPKPAPLQAAIAQADAEEDIPTTAEFEEAAEKEINKDSVDSEVDNLAKEIGE